MNEGCQCRSKFWMPRANNARGKVRGARPRIPVRGTPPETPAPFPFSAIFPNGPRCQGFAAPRKTGAPWTAPGRSGEYLRQGKGGNCKDAELCADLHALGQDRRRQTPADHPEHRIEKLSSNLEKGDLSIPSLTQLFRLIVRLEYAPDTRSQIRLMAGHVRMREKK